MNIDKVADSIHAQLGELLNQLNTASLQVRNFTLDELVDVVEVKDVGQMDTVVVFD